MSKKAPHKTCMPMMIFLLGCVQSAPKVPQAGARGAPAILEQDQAGVIRIRTAKVKLRDLLHLGILDRVPKQKLGSSQRMKPRIRAAILVNKTSGMIEGEHGCNRQIIFPGNANPEGIAKAGD